MLSFLYRIALTPLHIQLLCVYLRITGRWNSSARYFQNSVNMSFFTPSMAIEENTLYDLIRYCHLYSLRWHLDRRVHYSFDTFTLSSGKKEKSDSKQILLRAPKEQKRRNVYMEHFLIAPALFSKLCLASVHCVLHF